MNEWKCLGQECVYVRMDSAICLDGAVLNHMSTRTALLSCEQCSDTVVLTISLFCTSESSLMEPDIAGSDLKRMDVSAPWSSQLTLLYSGNGTLSQPVSVRHF